MNNELNKDVDKSKEYGIIRELIKFEDKFQVSVQLKSIIKLVNMLYNKYTNNNRLFKSDASKRTLNDEFNGQQYQIAEYIKDFNNAWNQFKYHSRTYISAHLPGSIASISYIEQIVDITIDTPLACFLPSKHGFGLLSYSLIYYLAQTHNSIIDLYKKKRKVFMEPVSIYSFDATQPFIIKNYINGIINANLFFR